MADLNDIAIFVKVAQFESFSRAAHALGMPVSTVSRRVADLEQQLGVTLLQRTTRKLTLTVPGQDYFHQCHEPLDILADAERVLTQTQKNHCPTRASDENTVQALFPGLAPAPARGPDAIPVAVAEPARLRKGPGGLPGHLPPDMQWPPGQHRRADARRPRGPQKHFSSGQSAENLPAHAGVEVG